MIEYYDIPRTGVRVETHSRQIVIHDPIIFAKLPDNLKALYTTVAGPGILEDMALISGVETYLSKCPEQLWGHPHQSLDLDALQDSLRDQWPILGAQTKRVFQNFLETFNNLSLYQRYGDRTIPRALRLAIIERDESTCRYCASPLAANAIHLDHVIPYSKGGKTQADNLVVSCAPCNQRKYNRSPEQAGMRLRQNYEH